MLEPLPSWPVPFELLTFESLMMVLSVPLESGPLISSAPLSIACGAEPAVPEPLLLEAFPSWLVLSELLAFETSPVLSKPLVSEPLICATPSTTTSGVEPLLLEPLLFVPLPSWLVLSEPSVFGPLLLPSAIMLVFSGSNKLSKSSRLVPLILLASEPFES